MRNQMPFLGQLQKENERQKKQFIHLTQRIDEIIGNMVQMKELDLKLKVMMNLETGEGNAPGGVGGSAPSLPWPDYSEAKTHKYGLAPPAEHRPPRTARSQPRQPKRDRPSVATASTAVTFIPVTA